MNNEARIDKWLWAARIFKTRSIAAAACKKGQVSMGGAQLKASRMIKAGDVVSVRKPPVTYSFRVLQPIERRDAAQLGQGKAAITIGHFNVEEPGMEYMPHWVGRALGTDEVACSFVPQGDPFHYVLAQRGGPTDRQRI